MYILFIIALILAAVTLVVGPFVITYAVLSRVKNRENAELRNEAEAHRKILESTYDHIWRTIKQRGGLTEGNRRSFNNIYPDLINNSIDDSEFLDWLLDCNPTSTRRSTCRLSTSSKRTVSASWRTRSV